MKQLWRGASLLCVTASLWGCAGNSEELLFESLGTHSPINLEKNQSDFTETKEMTSDQGLLLSTNTDFKSPRRLQRMQATLKDDLPLEKIVLEDLAQQEARQLFPNSDLQLKSLRSGMRFSYAEFEQHLNGRRIQGSKLVLRLDSEGNWYSAFSTLLGQELIAQAKTATDESIEFWSLPIGSEVLSEEKVYYPRVEEEGVKVYAARQLEVLSNRLQTGYVVWVNEEDSSVLAVFHPEHGLDGSDVRVMGSILPNSPEDESLFVELPFVRFQFADVELFTGTEGIAQLFQYEGQSATISLDNPFLSVVNNGGPDNAMPIQIHPDMSQDIHFDDFSSPEERNIYYWVMKARDFLEDELEFFEMDYQITAMARDGMRVDNAYFNPVFGALGMPVLGFGTGDKFLKNTALSRDIVLHEYGHAITHEIYGFRTNYEFRAMNEAFSDYFAATLTDDPAIADGAMKTRKWLRNIDNNMTYDTHYTGESFHYDGQLFSGALWRIRQGMDKHLADRMIHEARLAQAGSIREVMTELLIIDESFDDGLWYTPSPNKRLIRKAFLAQGLHSQTRFQQKKSENLSLPWAQSANHDANCWHLH